MSLLFFGMAIAGIARSLHASDAVQIGASIVSGLMSVTALALFIKAADTNRRRVIVLVSAAVLTVIAVLTFVALRH